MKPAACLALLGSAWLLISVANCDICPAVQEDVYVFLNGSPEEYVSYVQNYQSDPLVLQNALALKQCVDGKLTAEDKGHAISAVNKIFSDPLC
ncbi:major allergen I polypeptide chain 1-like [Oryctolagus cuniculus]|uniref:Secretoglobin family 1A member 1 n=1 Tax=Oryctolagus cuniculus TaxID=9986 RepID=G1U0C2_RABIT